jgi:hypothetical protein
MTDKSDGAGVAYDASNLTPSGKGDAERERSDQTL